MPLLNITPEAWQHAQDFFRDNPSNVKLRSKDSALGNSFIKVGNEIYAMARKEYLGEGTFGKVKVVQTKGGDNYALKIEGKGKRADDDAEKKVMELIGYLRGEEERELGKTINFKGQDTTKKLYTVTKLKEGKELFDELYLDKNAEYRKGTMTTTQSLIVALKACKAIDDLHQLNVLHCDIKPENFMANIKGNMIVIGAIDFGFSTILKPGQTFVLKDTTAGSPMFMAPEINPQKPFYKRPPYRFSKETDVYALGVLFQEDLQLSSDIFAGMIRSRPNDRTKLPDVMQKLVQKLESQPDLDDDARMVIAEFKEHLAVPLQPAQTPVQPEASMSTGASLPSATATEGDESKRINIAQIIAEITKVDSSIPVMEGNPRQRDVKMILGKLAEIDTRQIPEDKKNQLATQLLKRFIGSNLVDFQAKGIITMAAINKNIDLSAPAAKVLKDNLTGKFKGLTSGVTSGATVVRQHVVDLSKTDPNEPKHKRKF